MVFMTYFDIPKAAIVTHAIHLKDQGKLPHKTYTDIANNIIQVVINNYLHYNDDEVFGIENYGSYFPAVFKNPHYFI